MSNRFISQLDFSRNPIIWVWLVCLVGTVSIAWRDASSASAFEPKQTLVPVANSNIKRASDSLKIDEDAPLNPQVEKRTRQALSLYEAQLQALDKSDYNAYYDAQEGINELQKLNYNTDRSELEKEQAYIHAVKKKGLNFIPFAGAPTQAWGMINQYFFFSLFYDKVGLIVLGLVACLVSRYTAKSYQSIWLAWGNVMTLISLCALTYFGLVGILNGLGAANYPSSLDPTARLANFQETGLLLAYLAMVIGFLVVVDRWLQQLINPKLSWVVNSFTLLVSYQLLVSQGGMTKFGKYLPFYYLDGKKMLENALTHQSQSDYLIGISYLLGLSILIFAYLSKGKLRRPHETHH